jgi:hypothetical protein
VTVEDDDDQAASPGRQRKIIHVDMDAFLRIRRVLVMWTDRKDLDRGGSHEIKMPQAGSPASADRLG